MSIVLSHNQIFTGIRRQKVQQRFEMGGIVFRLHADVNFNLPGVLPLQIRQRGKIVLRLAGRHAEKGHIAIGERIGRVVRKA